MSEEEGWEIQALTVICVMAIAYLSYLLGRQLSTETFGKLIIFLILYAGWLICLFLMGGRIEWDSCSP